MLQVVVTDRYVDPAGRPLRGEVTFTPSIRFLDLYSGATVAVRPVTVRLKVDGTFQVALTATTGPDVDPDGWVWHVSEELSGAESRGGFDIALPYDGPSMVVLRELAPVPDFSPVVFGPGFDLLYDGGTP